MNGDKEILDREIQLLDEVIKNKLELIELAKSDAYKNIIKAFQEEKLAAIQDYMKDNSPFNQAYSRLWNFVCNLLELFQDSIELNNLLF